MAAKKRPQRRRPKGGGTVYPIKNRHGEIIAYYAVLTIDGRTVRRREPDAQAAEVALAELRRLRDANVAVADAETTVEAWCGVWYALMVREGRYKPRTLADYRRMIESYIAPLIGDTKLGRLRQADVQAFVFAVRDGIATHTAYDGAATAIRCALVLKMALELAVDRGILAESPYRKIRLPPRKPRAVPPPTEEQVAAFLTAARGHRFEALWSLYALLGLRLGEGLGLRWADYDPAARTIRVAQQVQRLDRQGETAGHIFVGTPKSDAGVRLLPCPDAVCALLDTHRVRQLAERVRRADTWQDHDLIFCSRDGRPMSPRDMQTRWRALWAAAGLPAANVLHDLRRAVATMLDEADATETIKAAILGHAKQSITQHYVRHPGLKHLGLCLNPKAGHRRPSDSRPDYGY